MDDESSRLNEPAIETPRHISNNHMDMVRFKGIDDNEYRKVASAINLVIRGLGSTGPVKEESEGKANFFMVGQNRDLAMDVKLPLPPERLEARKQLMNLLYFHEIDARLLSLKSAYNKTCRWILEKREHCEWLSPEKINDHHGFLWIKGKPGAGKSILMKFLDKDARNTAIINHKIIVLSFFFNARGEELERTTLGLYRSLLWQLLKKLEEIQAVLDLFEMNAHAFIQRLGWQTEILKDTLANAVESEHFKGGQELRLFIDALDECIDNDVADMVSFFEELGERAAEQNINLRICVSSRYYPTISVKKGIVIKLDEEEEHSLDIVRYIDSQLKLGTFEGTKKADDLRTQILEKSAGIFLWVALVIPILNKKCSGGRLDRFQMCLNDIPSGLNELFEIILTRDEEDLHEFRLCIQWILFAVPPLKIEEYYFALLKPDNHTAISDWNSGDITQEHMHQFVSSSSKGFAEVTRTRSERKELTVQFIHESVRDFFLLKDSDWKRSLWPQIDGKTFASFSHNILRDRCLEEINRWSQDPTSGLTSPPDTPPEASLGATESLQQLVSNKMPFLEYATRYLLYHADAAAVDFPQGAFLERIPVVIWTNLYKSFAEHDDPFIGSSSLIHILFDKGLERLVKAGVAMDMDINVSNKHGWTPLSRAAAKGQESIVKLLLEKDVDVNSKDKSSRTPLWQAAKNGYESTTKLLLEEGADVDLKDAYSRTPLWQAATNEYEGVITLLLDKGADIDSKDKHGQTSLYQAATNGYEGITKLLLEKGADVDSKDNSNRTPLWQAATKGHEGVLQLLLDNGADVDSRDIHTRTPLYRATANGRKGVIRLLLKKGAKVNLKSKINGRTPLWEATRIGYEDIVQMLLEKGAKVDSEDKNGQTLLWEAIIIGRENIVKLLLDHGAEVNAKDNKGRTPLDEAVRMGDQSIIQLLVDREAKVDSEDKNGQTLLWEVIRIGRGSIVKLFLDYGAEVNAKDHKGRTPLDEATRMGDQSIVQLLVDRGAKGGSKAM